MLNKKNRITKKEEYDYIFKKGKSYYNKACGVKVLKNNKKEAKLGIIISKKVSKKAVDRNRIKRVIREVVRKEILKNRLIGNDIVVIVLPEAIKKTNQEINDEVLSVLSKIQSVVW